MARQLGGPVGGPTGSLIDLGTEASVWQSKGI